MTKLTLVPKKKLSAYCIACGGQHSTVWMQWYLDIIEPKQKIENKTGGILCAVCFERTMRETATDEEAPPKLRALAQRIVDLLDQERKPT